MFQVFSGKQQRESGGRKSTDCLAFIETEEKVIYFLISFDSDLFVYFYC